jgi:hypothetical protein
MTEWLHKYANNYPTLTHLSSIGRSVEERELWVMIVARNPKVFPTFLREQSNSIDFLAT